MKNGHDCWRPSLLGRLNELTSPCRRKYSELKKEILARLGLSSVCAAQYFHNWEYKPRLPARAQAAKLSRLARHWLLDGEPTAAQVAERVVIDRFLRALLRTHRQAVGMRNPATIAELVEAVELADAGELFPLRGTNPCQQRFPHLPHGRGWQAVLCTMTCPRGLQKRR